jgi:murein DD-endopeptidase MepM/ murein hydrolase activator NlpD
MANQIVSTYSRKWVLVNSKLMDDVFILYSKINTSNFQKYYFSSSKMAMCSFDSDETFDSKKDWLHSVCEKQMSSPVVLVSLGEIADLEHQFVSDSWRLDFSSFDLKLSLSDFPNVEKNGIKELRIGSQSTFLGSYSNSSYCKLEEFSEELLSDWLLFVEQKESQSYFINVLKYLIWLPLILASLTLWYFNSEKVFNSSNNWKSAVIKSENLCPNGIENPSKNVKSNLSQFRNHFYQHGYLIQSKKTLERWRGIELDCLNDMVEPWVFPIKNSEMEAIEYYRSLLSDSLTYPTDLWNRIEGEKRKHDGLDISAPIGTRILSPSNGQVFSWESPRGGKIVAVKNENNVFWVAHCERILFFSGDSVRKGEAIATVGMTGRTSGPHAHIGTGRFRSFVGDGKIRMSLMDPIEWYHKKIK